MVFCTRPLFHLYQDRMDFFLLLFTFHLSSIPAVDILSSFLIYRLLFLRKRGQIQSQESREWKLKDKERFVNNQPEAGDVR